MIDVYTRIRLFLPNEFNEKSKSHNQSCFPSIFLLQLQNCQYRNKISIERHYQFFAIQIIFDCTIKISVNIEKWKIKIPSKIIMNKQEPYFQLSGKWYYNRQILKNGEILTKISFEVDSSAVREIVIIYQLRIIVHRIFKNYIIYSPLQRKYRCWIISTR